MARREADDPTTSPYAARENDRSLGDRDASARAAAARDGVDARHSRRRVTQTYKLVPDALGGDEITFLAAGDVIAGIDLSKLQQKDVWRSPDGTINLRLPPPQVLISRVDNNESRVVMRKTGMLRRADVDLETRARQHAEANIRAEAVKKGILQIAQQSGEKKMGEFLHTLGFQRVRFVNAPGPSLPR